VLVGPGFAGILLTFTGTDVVLAIRSRDLRFSSPRRSHLVGPLRPGLASSAIADFTAGSHARA
jgi:hypothetical protein